MLSRNRNAYREEPAGPQRETPGAQCHGPQTVEIGLFLYAGEWHESGLLAAAERFRHPFTTVAGWNADPDHAPVVPDGGVSVNGAGVVLTSCRAVGNDTEVRVVAMTPEPTTAVVRSAGRSQEVPLRGWQIAGARLETSG
jgi:alpha-mannosidase